MVGDQSKLCFLLIMAYALGTSANAADVALYRLNNLEASNDNPQ